MKEIILLDARCGHNDERTEFYFGDYCFVYIAIANLKYKVENLINLEKYAKAVYNVLEYDDITELESVGRIIYSVSTPVPSFEGIYKTSIESFSVTDINEFNKFAETIKAAEASKGTKEEIRVSFCKELLIKLAKLYNMYTSTDEEAETTLPANTIDVQTTLVDEEKKKADSKKRKERIEKKLKELEEYNKNEEARKAFSSTTPIILPTTNSSMMHPEGCTCGCNSNTKSPEEIYKEKLEEALKFGLINDPVNPIAGIDYDVVPEFADINVIKQILSSHTANYQNKWTYWRAVPRQFLRDTDENNVITDLIRDKIQSGEFPRTTVNGSQDFYICNYPGLHMLDVVSVDKDGTPIPALSMIIDYLGAFSFLPDPVTGQMKPSPSIYVGCSVIQHTDFCRWCHGMQTEEPLVIQAVPFTLKNLSYLMNLIDAKRFPQN